MDQNLSLYKIFYTAACEKSISKAAKKLYISQPAISKSIRKLEESLGVTLFIRNSRGVRLTEEGSLLFSHVRTAFEAISSGEERIRQIADLETGHLRIGVSTTLCKYMLLPYLKSFIHNHPHIRITLECQSSNRTFQLLREGNIDLGLVGGPKLPKDIPFYPLGEIQDTFVAGREYLEHLDLSGSCDKDLFSDVTLMLLDQENMTRQYIDDYLQAQQIHPGSLLEVSTMDLLIDFAKIGLGVACVIREFVSQELELGILEELPLAASMQKRPVGFICSPHFRYHSAVSEFLKEAGVRNP